MMDVHLVHLLVGPPGLKPECQPIRKRAANHVVKGSVFRLCKFMHGRVSCKKEHKYFML